MYKRTLILALVIAVVALSGASLLSAQEGVILGPVTQRVLDRGELICGVNANLTGFGVVNDAGEFSGFDVDICRAVAVAILGDANAVSFRPLTGAERQAAIQGGEIDMMSRNTTWTLSRDSVWGATFGPTTFYDGQGVGTRAELGITSLDGLDGASVCVQQGTTTELNITDAVSSRGLDIDILTFPDAPSTWQSYLDGRCEAWTTDISGIISFHAGAPDPGEHMILNDVLSKEPLGPLSPQNDPQFADIIAWTVFGLITGEELGITSENVMDFVGSDDPVVQRFLGSGDNAAGSYLGIQNDFMVNVISQIGNYGEIYARNLGPLNVPRGVNALWTAGGLLYAPPFR
jgi:general L-amino acid transport system substrate-binding protein